ncbi:Uncharacterized protein ESCO_003064 [Escovopsis weberi]|uniref:TAP42-like protein n=1 Tax=Escovopsis weberi TaxID=150374 RepID=A0A0M8N275_ESCWE|nr:Uncharacterized protein ESCO_003064 [Escovopsis weberi]
MASSDEPQSLRTLFEEAESKREDVEANPNPMSPQYAETLSAAISAYGRVAEHVSAVGLFSPNEGLEDLATSSVPYLLVEFHVAELVQRTPRLAPKEKLRVLRRARASYERFLGLAEGYGLVRAPYDRLLERYRDDEEGFAVAAGADAAARRETKIASFRAEKALRERLDALRRDPRYGDGGGGGGGGDEEVVREAYLADVAFKIHAAFQGLDSMNREIPLLRSAPSPTLDPRAAAAAAGAGNAEDTSLRLDRPFGQFRPGGGGGGPLLSRQGKPLQPFTLVGSRDAMARGVFRPGHNLPTMSIDEYLEEEKRRGNILSGGTDPQKPEVDEDDEEAVDREMYKAREWDEFKDANRRGAGNTMNMG